MTIETLLTIRSLIAEPLKQSFNDVAYPSTLDQLSLVFFLKTEGAVLAAQENVILPGPEEGWREVGEQQIWFHSKWAANYARILDAFRRAKYFFKWEYQPKCFPIKESEESYIPDFLITFEDGEYFWVETKPIVEDINLLSKISKFQSQYPNERLLEAPVDLAKGGTLLRMKECIVDWEE